MEITIKSKDALATISSVGAELISFMDILGHEYIWQKDANFWGGASPLLFPIIGNLRDGKVIIDSKEYSMSKHGFCRNTEFKVTYQSEDKVIFNYTYNEETLKVYPYKFSISLTYTITGPSLSIRYDVLNLDDKEIYYCLGAHPAFNVPFNKTEKFEDYSLVFNKNEYFNSPIYDLEKLEFNVSNTTLLMDNTNKLDLKYELFDNDAVLLDNVSSSSVKLVHKHFGRGVQVDFKGFTSIAFWTPIKKNAPFLCIEPWNGSAVKSDEGDEFSKKNGVITLEKSQQNSHSIKILPL